MNWWDFNFSQIEHVNWNIDKGKTCPLHFKTISTSEAQNMAEFLNAHYLERLCETYYRSNLLSMKQAASIKIKKFDIIVAGVKKCGTSSLELFMKYHPELKSYHFYAHEGHYFDIGTVFLPFQIRIYDSGLDGNQGE